MKIATGIISLVLMLIVGLQSCAVSVGGTMAKDDNTSGAGFMGVVVALLYLIGGAFSFTKPHISIGTFAVSCIIGLYEGLTTRFQDMAVWGVVSLVLAIMSYYAYRGELKKNTQQDDSVQV